MILKMESSQKCIKIILKKVIDSSITAERLIQIIVAKSDEEWQEPEKDIDEYIVSKPSESELTILHSFADMIVMRCSAIRLKQNNRR